MRVVQDSAREVEVAAAPADRLVLHHVTVKIDYNRQYLEHQLITPVAAPAAMLYQVVQAVQAAAELADQAVPVEMLQ